MSQREAPAISGVLLPLLRLQVLMCGALAALAQASASSVRLVLVKVVLTIDGDQCVIHDPATEYAPDTLTDWIDQARRALHADDEMHLLADTELAADEAGDDDGDEPVGFRGRRR